MAHRHLVHVVGEVDLDLLAVDRDDAAAVAQVHARDGALPASGAVVLDQGLRLRRGL
jgi:hypothetical protein